MKHNILIYWLTIKKNSRLQVFTRHSFWWPFRPFTDIYLLVYQNKFLRLWSLFVHTANTNAFQNLFGEVGGVNRWRRKVFKIEDILIHCLRVRSLRIPLFPFCKHHNGFILPSKTRFQKTPLPLAEIMTYYANRVFQNFSLCIQRTRTFVTFQD